MFVVYLNYTHVILHAFFFFYELSLYVPGSKLPLFPDNRGWETQPNSRDLYTHYKDSYERWENNHPQQNATFDHGTYIFTHTVYVPERRHRRFDFSLVGRITRSQVRRQGEKSSPTKHGGIKWDLCIGGDQTWYKSMVILRDLGW